MRVSPIPIRRIAGAVALVLCTVLAISNHYESLLAQPPDWISFGAPAPPSGAFLLGFLAFPGLLVGLPFVLAGAYLNLDWVAELGFILGAAYFWYSVGWYADCSLSLSDRDSPPRYVTLHIAVLEWIGVISMPFLLLAGLKLGEHMCAVGVPPLWSEIVMFCIVGTWATVGSFLVFSRLRQRRASEQENTLRIVS